MTREASGENEDGEAEQIKRALQRGVAEEVVLQGYFHATPHEHDRDVDAITAPHLFAEDLGEGDLPSEVIAKEYLLERSSLAQRADVLTRCVEESNPRGAGGHRGRTSLGSCNTSSFRRSVSAAAMAWARAEDSPSSSPTLPGLPAEGCAPDLDIGFSLEGPSPKRPRIV